MVVKIFYNTHNLVQSSRMMNPEVRKNLLDQIFITDRDVLTAIKEKTKSEAIVSFNVNQSFLLGCGFILTAEGEAQVGDFVKALKDDRERFNKLCMEV